MGLDQYAYAAAQAGDHSKWWDGAELDPDTRQYQHPTLTKPRELAYWRKHPNLQGWMHRLWLQKMVLLLIALTSSLKIKNRLTSMASNLNSRGKTLKI